MSFYQKTYDKVKDGLRTNPELRHCWAGLEKRRHHGLGDPD